MIVSIEEDAEVDGHKVDVLVGATAIKHDPVMAFGVVIGPQKFRWELFM